MVTEFDNSQRADGMRLPTRDCGRYASFGHAGIIPKLITATDPPKARHRNQPVPPSVNRRDKLARRSAARQPIFCLDSALIRKRISGVKTTRPKAKGALGGAPFYTSKTIA